ncbi:hypothetical protein DO70_855 [Burkholderia pseudomallei]|nr:hypothetical protein DO70_855 [Burkholderia pseudomallei]
MIGGGGRPLAPRRLPRSSRQRKPNRGFQAARVRSGERIDVRLPLAPHRRRRPQALGAPPHARSSSISFPAIFSSGRTSLMPQAAIAASGML